MSMVSGEQIGQNGQVAPAVLRSVLGNFATGVTVMTTVAENGDRVGMTVSSFNSLSLDPPLILWSIGLGAPSRAVFSRSAHFAVNVLRDDQADIAFQFAKPSKDKFHGIACETGLNGLPVLSDALATFECEMHERVEGGDHEIYLGRVMRARSAAEGEPLVYHRGGFGEFKPF